MFTVYCRTGFDSDGVTLAWATFSASGPHKAALKTTLGARGLINVSSNIDTREKMLPKYLHFYLHFHLHLHSNLRVSTS